MPTSGLLKNSDRIVLLLEEVDHGDGYVAPYTICQDGISEALDMLKNNVSRELSKLKDEGIVEEELYRVKGIDRRRKIYTLTEHGEEAAEEIEERLKKKEIPIEKGKRSRIKIKDAVEMLKKEDPGTTPFQVEEHMRKNDVLNVEEFRPALFGEDQKEKVSMVVDAPAKGELYGRQDEREEIQRALDRDVPPVILMTGIAGIGKSSLGAMVMKELDKDILWYTFKPWDDLESLSEMLSEFCVRAGLEKLDTDERFPKMVNRFVQHLSGLEPVIFLDDCENISGELRLFLELMLDHKKRGEDFGLVLMSRRELDFYDVRDVMEDHVLELELGPLDLEAVRKMVGEDAEGVYELTDGHPLYVELTKKYEGETVHMNEFIEKEIYSELDSGEKDVLRRASVFWEPVEKEVLLEKGDMDLLPSLKNRGLITETKDGRVTLHSIIRDFFYDHMSVAEKKELHGWAAERLGGRELEVLHHLEEADDWEGCLNGLSELVPTIASMGGSIREDIIENIPEVPEERRGELDEILGDIYLKAQGWEHAKASYEDAVRRGNDNTAVREKLGEAQMKLEQWRGTIQSHEEALGKYKKKGDAKGMIREYLSLGTVYRRKGEYDKAERYNGKAEELLEKEKMPDLKPTLHNNMAMLYMSRNEMSRAERMFRRALKEGGDSGVIHENLFRLYAIRGDTGKALDSLEKAVEEYMNSGKKNDAIDLLLDSSDLYVESGNRKGCIRNLRRAIEIEGSSRKGFSLFGRGEMSVREIKAHDRLADVLKHDGWKGCLNHRVKAIEGYRELGEDERRYRSRLKYVFDLHDSGRQGKALDELGDLKQELRKEEMTGGLNACEFEEARIYMERGDYERGESVLEGILQRTQNYDDEAAESRARDMLDEVQGMMGKG